MNRAAVLSLAAAALACGQDLQKIKAAATQDAHAYAYLEELSNVIGPRLTGSPAAAKATEWARAKMESIGLRNAHLEGWTLARGWRRGIAQAELISPFRLPLNVSSYGWSGSTNSLEAEVILDGKLLMVRTTSTIAIIKRDPRPGIMLTHTQPVTFPLSGDPPPNASWTSRTNTTSRSNGC
jgi:hypothetical protein